MPLENKKNLSIIIPVFNELNFINKLYKQLVQYFNDPTIEVIFVDDGSTDGSSERLEKIKLNNKHSFTFKVIKLLLIRGKEKQFKQELKFQRNIYYYKMLI